MALFAERLPATGGSAVAPSLLLIHGWGHCSDIWRPLLPTLRPHFNLTLVDLPGFGRSPGPFPLDTETLLDQLLAHCRSGQIVVGFSLGGMLAVQMAARQPGQIAAVITLASNWCFVASAAWPNAMEQEAFTVFSSTVAASPVVGVKRFNALQSRGANNEKALLRQLRNGAQVAADDLSIALQCLARLDNTALAPQLPVPLLNLLADGDTLVPVAVAEHMRAAGADVEVIAGAAHPLFLSQPAQVVEHWLDFLHRCKLAPAGPMARRLDKQSVARSFSRAADTYDSVAQLQRDVAGSLLAALPTLANDAVVMDLGCGTGYCLPVLREQYGEISLIGADLAEGMVHYAATHQSAVATHWLCADAENLPLADSSVDLVISSLAIQWCEDPAAVMAEVFRVLRPGGRLLFTTLGPNTLVELKRAWQAVDALDHVNQFCSQALLHEAISDAGLHIVDWREQVITLGFDNVKSSVNALKQLGAGNQHTQRPRGLAGRQRLQSFRQAYEAQRDHRGLLPASYQVWFAQVEKHGVN